MAGKLWWAKVFFNIFIGFLLLIVLALAAGIIADRYLPAGEMRNSVFSMVSIVFGFGVYTLIPVLFAVVFAAAFIGAIWEVSLNRKAGLNKAIFEFYNATHGLETRMKIKQKEEAIAELRGSSVAFGKLDGASLASALSTSITDAAVVTDFNQTRFLVRLSTSPKIAFMYDAASGGGRYSTVIQISAIAKAKTKEVGKVEYQHKNILQSGYSLNVKGDSIAIRTATNIVTTELREEEIKKLVLSGDLPARIEFRDGYVIVVLMLFAQLSAFFATKKVEAIFEKIDKNGLIE